RPQAAGGPRGARQPPGPAPGRAVGRGRATPRHPSPPAELENGTPISQQLLARLMCDAELVPVLVDGLGNPLDVGRTLRLHTAKQRVALAERDRGCTWPGCTAPVSWTEAHHLTPWQHGGGTSVHDGALLCGRHHRYVHAIGATGRVVNGRVVWDAGPPGQAGPEPPATSHLITHLLRQWLTPRGE
ncbi:MAG: HNH endonuclease signature motif containing protein, partial [Angustibacter sp.]